MHISHLAISFVALTLLGVSAAAVAENRIDTQRPDAPQLAAYGSFPIGVRTLEFVNTDQVNILAIDAQTSEPASLPRYDRPLTVEVWYPAEDNTQGPTELAVFLRDGKTEVSMFGRGMRDVPPAKGRYPLVIISHGYPGNRYLLAHLAENLASKGYVVASIDHTDSTYRTLAGFTSTLVNRPLDQLFVLEQMAELNNDASSFLNGLVDANNSALIGYSMGGYGAIISAGGGVTKQAVQSDLAPPFETLAIHQTGSKEHNTLPDKRIKTAIVFGPWGKNVGVWDDQSLLGVNIPMLLVAGSADDVSGYETGIRAIWKATKNVDRSLLTYENANHNAGAPFPAPEESFKQDPELGFNVSEHYTDPVWNSTRMNNIAQHFVTAWLGKYLKTNPSMDEYLQLIEHSNEGVWSQNQDGTVKSGHTYWHGFPNRTATGLRFESLSTGR